jgi:hypothetical protein
MIPSFITFMRKGREPLGGEGRDSASQRDMILPAFSIVVIRSAEQSGYQFNVVLEEYET